MNQEIGNRGGVAKTPAYSDVSGRACLFTVIFKKSYAEMVGIKIIRFVFFFKKKITLLI